MIMRIISDGGMITHRSIAAKARIISRQIESERLHFRRKVLSFFTLLVSRSFLPPSKQTVA